MKNLVILVIFIILSALFYFLPVIDLWASHLFYTPDNGFLYRNEPWIEILYKACQNLHLFLIPIFLIALLLGRKFLWFKVRRKLVLFALCVLVVGPGLIVNVGLKDNWDRARPRHIVEFGGDKQFSAAWVVSDQCERNCSFVSGHAAMGFYAMILGWLLASRRWLYVGVTFGVLMGAIRVIQGGHFLSDSIFAGFIVYLVIIFFARYLHISEPK